MFQVSEAERILHSLHKTNILTVMSNETASLEGLNSGVPTRTTATLTPTTLRNIEQTFIEIQCQVESHQNQAGFVPPIVQPANQGVYMSVIDAKGWQGGSARVSEQQNNVSLELVGRHSLPPVLPTPMRRNVGGRRPNKDKSISPEEEAKRVMRRERNKMAAARCRKRRLDHTNDLIEETDGLEEKKQDLQKEIQKLQMVKEELEYMLEAHKASCRLIQPESPPDIKPIIAKIEPEEMIAPPPSKKVCTARPTSLSVPPAFTHPIPPEIAIVPITTPTAGIPFNFESLMEGGTGLTPVSAPLVPSCSSQQRTNSGCVDLSSPDSSKLVSL